MPVKQTPCADAVVCRLTWPCRFRLLMLVMALLSLGWLVMVVLHTVDWLGFVVSGVLVGTGWIASVSGMATYRLRVGLLQRYRRRLCRCRKAQKQARLTLGFTHLLDALPKGYAYQLQVQDGDYRLVYCSRGFREFWSIPEHEDKHILRYISSRLDTQSLQQVKRIGEHARKSDQPFDMVLPIYHADDIVQWVRLCGQPYAYRGRRMVGGVMVDVTGQKEVEQALQRRVEVERLVSEISTTLASADDSLMAGIIDRSLQLIGRGMHVDHVYLARFDHSTSQIHVDHEWSAQPRWLLADRRMLPMSRFPWFLSLLMDNQSVVIADSRQLPAEAVCEQELFATMIDQACVIVPMFQDGQCNGALIVRVYEQTRHWLDEDVRLLRTIVETMGTAIGRADRERALRSARDQAETATRAKSAFLANVSHELRTPLNAILGMIRLLQDHARDSEQSRLLAMVDESGHVLTELVEQLLDLSRIEFGRVELVEQSVLLPDFCRQLIGMLSLRAQSLQLDMHARVTPDHWPRLQVDASRLRQVLINLLDNAMKFTAGGGEVVLSARLVEQTAASCRLQLAVTDTGVGIDADELQKIFEPFVRRQKLAHAKPGFGLGLTISQEIVHAMGGHIHVESRLGQGTRFWFELTLAVSSKQQMPESEQCATVCPRSSCHILLVEDVPANREVACRFLQQVGHQVSEATTGQEAVDMVSGQRFDLILLDMRLPDMDGLAVLNAIRHGQSSMNRTVPVLAVTANIFEDDIECYHAAGVQQVLGKPYSFERLHEAVDGLLNLSDADAAGSVDLPVDEDTPPMLVHTRRLDRLLENLGPDRFAETARLACESIQCELQWLVEHADSEAIDGTIAAFHVHRLAGASANLGMEQLTDLARAIEKQLSDSASTPALELHVEQLGMLLQSSGHDLAQWWSQVGLSVELLSQLPLFGLNQIPN